MAGGAIRAAAVVIVAVAALSACSTTRTEPQRICTSGSTSAFTANELSERLIGIGAFERPGFVGAETPSMSRYVIYWFGAVPADVDAAAAHARACGVTTVLRAAPHSTVELDALRRRISVDDKAAWARYGLTVIETSNRVDGSAVQVVVPDSVSIAEAQSFASARYSIPVRILSETDAGL